MQAIMAKVLTEAPPSLSRVRRDLPPKLEATVLTALQKDPAQRFDSAATMLAAIDGRRVVESPRRVLSTTVRRGALAGVGLAIVAAIALRMTRVPLPPTAPRHVADTAAIRLVAEANELSNQRSPQICVEAIRRSSRATEIDSLYPAAWATLARARALCALFGDADPNVEFAAARGPAETALRLDSTLADAYTARGMVRLFREQDFTAAGHDFASASRFDSTRYEPWLFRTWVHLANDQLDSALASVRHAKLIAPANAPIVRTRLATILRYAGDTSAAERELEDALRLYPANSLLLGERFELNVHLRRCDRARADLAWAQHAPSEYLRTVVAYFWATCGDRPRAVRYADSLAIVASGDAYVDEFELAMVYAGVQDSVGMYRWLDRAVTHHDWLLFYLRHHFAFRPYVDQPAFAALMRRAHVR
jgi:tetratricopeptide (TPR) repeat protein